MSGASELDDDEGATSVASPLDELARGVRDRHVILFVGAGVSASLGVPTWAEFIGRLGEDLGAPAREFLAYGADFRSLAEFYRLEKGSLESLSRRMRSEWHVGDRVLRSSTVHTSIVRLDFPVVYTTNYDALLERTYALAGRRFNKIVTAKDIGAIDPGLPTIVKFHGDLAAPDSLVLAETDYLRRLSFEHPLDITLAADALSKAVLFVGYSVSDINLRLLLFRLHSLWRASGSPQARPRSFVLMTQRNRVQERILGSWDVTPLVVTASDETRALASFLESLCTARER